MSVTLTPERFEELRLALGWRGERAEILHERLVKDRPYGALSVLTGRDENALESVVKRARHQIRLYESAQRREPEEVSLSDYVHAARLGAVREFREDFDDYLFAVQVVAHHRRPEPVLSALEQVRRWMDLYHWREERVMKYLAGEAPYPY